MKNLLAICKKYGFEYNTELCKDLSLLIKDTQIVSLIKVNEIKGYDNEIVFYDLDFFKTHKLEVIKKVSKQEDIEKLIFDLILNNKKVKLTKIIKDYLNEFDRKIVFSYRIVSERIKEEIIGKHFKLISIYNSIDKDNRKIVFSLLKRKNNVNIKLTFNIKALFDKNEVFLSNIEICDKLTKDMSTALLNLLTNEKLFESFTQVYFERKNKFILDKVL